jgi:hypothetical protein
MVVAFMGVQRAAVENHGQGRRAESGSIRKFH